jgi:histo-blood group ABO system transferase
MNNTTSKTSLGIITIATGRYYDEFIPTLRKSVDTYLHDPNLDVHFYCFTDSAQQTPGVHHFPIKHLAWPFSTLMRFHWIKEQLPTLGQHDFLLYMDADMKLVSPMPTDIFNNPLVAVQHPGFVDTAAPFELDRTDSAYVAPPLRKHYFQGCFWGGQTAQFKTLIEQLSKLVNQDLAKASIPIWHDESYLNHYLATKNCHPLPPQFAWPQGVPDGGRVPYVLHLEKPHNQIRQVEEHALDLAIITDDQNTAAQLQFYKRLYLISHEKCQRLELRLAQGNSLWAKVREWLSYYKNKDRSDS